MRPFLIAVLALGVAGGASASVARTSSSLPVAAIESALHAKGQVSQHVLVVEIDRDDIKDVTIHGVAIKPSFEINGDIDFQPLSRGRVLMNGDLPFKPSEIDRVLSAMLANGITFQAEHQHMYDFSPMVWFMHFRAVGDPVKIATAMHAVLQTTSAPLPQQPPKHPKTPLNTQKLKSILGGDDVTVGSDGVVTVELSRKQTIHLGGVAANQTTNLDTNIAFEPLNASGTRAAAMPDFGMTANEIDGVVSTMRSQGWDIGCLYNQETDESPQLYFSHEFKVGNPYELAAEIRKGLDHMNV